MSCVQSEPTVNADSEMEEGEIVDDLDDLSDISSEEEFLLRERLQVLENYNNVLERKKAKDSSNDYGELKLEDALSHDLSEISDAEEIYPLIPLKSHQREEKHSTVSYKARKRKHYNFTSFGKTKDHKKKSHRSKKKHSTKISNVSSESEDEYRNKRRKLANAVSVKSLKNDSSSLKARINKMLNPSKIPQCIKTSIEEEKSENILNSISWSVNSSVKDIVELNSEKSKNISNDDNMTLEDEISELIDLCKDEDSKNNIENTILSHDCVDSGKDTSKKSDEIKEKLADSDEDLELLRQYALKTKSNKFKSDEANVNKAVPIIKPSLSEDEDSDTAELRLICLKSAFLKKAIELKRKQKRQRKMSQSFHNLDNNFESNDIDPENNTDMESVDMDMGSDVDDKLKDISNSKDNTNATNTTSLSSGKFQSKEEEFEEDEDLLRAKLLTSLSRNLPNIIGNNLVNSLQEVSNAQTPIIDVKQTNLASIPEQKPLIINLGESDSEGEHEATKNLTKMHMKLSEQVDFQQKLDLFLKSTRMEVERRTLPDVIQKPLQEVKSTPKFVAKAVKHLPKSEQMEYRYLVKRMAELEKIKQARQTSMNSYQAVHENRDTLKPRNVTIETVKNDTINNLEQQIALSRKNIAEESAKMLKLKEEGTKLAQKYKIVATELRNIATAITLNKKEQKSVNNKLSKIRLHHQTLLKRSPSTKLINKNTLSISLGTDNNISTVKLQKENNPIKDQYKNPHLLKSVKVSVVNDLKVDTKTNSNLSVQIDVSSNKKIVKIPHDPVKERVVDMPGNKINLNVNVQEIVDSTNQCVESERQRIENNDVLNINNAHNVERYRKDLDDYRSPLEALQAETWLEDPNSFLCPFEVGGTCKDPDCKYLHPKIPTCQ